MATGIRSSIRRRAGRIRLRPTVTAGQHANVGTVTAAFTSDEGTTTRVSDQDRSHHFGQSAPDHALGASTDATFENKALPGETVTLKAVFTRSLADQARILSIDWGDGTLTPGTIDPQTKLATATHSYATGGIFTITVTVSDDTGDIFTETTTAVVTGVRLADNGELQIIGTSGKDIVNVRLLGGEEENDRG